MSAEPAQVEDPNDPEVILRDLPEQERAEFLRQYHRAVDAAHEPARVVEYPDDPMRTFPTSDPYVRRAEFGAAGLVTFVINDADQTVTLTDVTWAG
jgi:hypothetical protein